MHKSCRLENASGSGRGPFSESAKIQLVQLSFFICVTSHGIGSSIRRRRLREGDSEEHEIKTSPKISAYSNRRKTCSFGSALTPASVSTLATTLRGCQKPLCQTPYISDLHTIAAKSKTDELAHEYRRYCFQTPAIRQQFLFDAVGTKVSGISKSSIPKLAMPFPTVPEQTAIADVLSDMDAELAVLEQRCDKTRAVKQGMMQELLTGKTRLV